uniref:Uncharacterized protein n=1 Tax=Anguilla anguilla TaxID=7936 RepID=A0A0E9UPG8_ANGAN
MKFLLLSKFPMKRQKPETEFQ